MLNLKPVALTIVGAGLVAGCQTPAPAPATPAPPPAPVVAEAPPPPEAAPPAAAPVVPYPASAIPKAFANAVTLLEAGREDQAKLELQRILAGEPGNAKAANLLRQITDDPATRFGRDSFVYTVGRGETMSQIAGRCLNDIYSFYILARYNGIAVPKQLGEGQTLHIPGKPTAACTRREAAEPREKAPAPTPAPAPVEPPPPPPAPAPAPVPAPPPAPAQPSAAAKALQAGQAAEARGDLEGALAQYTKAGSEPGASAKADAVRKRLLVQRYSLVARTAFAKQDLDGAIRGWDNVLAVDPDNETAKLERQRAVTLKAKVDSLKK